VVVNFDLWFNQRIDVNEAEQQLGAGLQEAAAGGLVIDRNSIQIKGDQGLWEVSGVTVRSQGSLGGRQGHCEVTGVSGRSAGSL